MQNLIFIGSNRGNRVLKILFRSLNCRHIKSGYHFFEIPLPLPNFYFLLFLLSILAVSLAYVEKNYERKKEKKKKIQKITDKSFLPPRRAINNNK